MTLTIPEFVTYLFLAYSVGYLLAWYIHKRLKHSAEVSFWRTTALTSNTEIKILEDEICNLKRVLNGDQLSELEDEL